MEIDHGHDGVAGDQGGDAPAAPGRFGHDRLTKGESRGQDGPQVAGSGPVAVDPTLEGHQGEHDQDRQGAPQQQGLALVAPAGLTDRPNQADSHQPGGDGPEQAHLPGQEFVGREQILPTAQRGGVAEGGPVVGRVPDQIGAVDQRGQRRGQPGLLAPGPAAAGLAGQQKGEQEGRQQHGRILGQHGQPAGQAGQIPPARLLLEHGHGGAVHPGQPEQGQGGVVGVDDGGQVEEDCSVDQQHDPQPDQFILENAAAEFIEQEAGQGV